MTTTLTPKQIKAEHKAYWKRYAKVKAIREATEKQRGRKITWADEMAGSGISGKKAGP